MTTWKTGMTVKCISSHCDCEMCSARIGKVGTITETYYGFYVEFEDGEEDYYCEEDLDTYFEHYPS